MENNQRTQFIKHLEIKRKRAINKRDSRRGTFWFFLVIWVICFGININAINNAQTNLINVLKGGEVVNYNTGFESLAAILTLPALVLWIVYACLWGGASREIKRIDNQIEMETYKGRL